MFFSSTHLLAPDKYKAFQFSLTPLCSGNKSVVNKKKKHTFWQVLWYNVKLFLVTFSVNVMHMYAVSWILSLLFGLVAQGFHLLIIVAEVRVMCYWFIFEISCLSSLPLYLLQNL